MTGSPPTPASSPKRASTSGPASGRSPRSSTGPSPPRPCQPPAIETLKATKILSSEGIKVNVTLIFSPLQALLAAKAGAAFVSPFVGRLDDIGEHGIDLVSQIRTIFDNYGYDTEIIAASIRGPAHVLDAALIGADIATIPYDTLKLMIKHPKTDEGVAKFIADYEKSKKS